MTFEDRQRAAIVCAGCGGEKPVTLVVCWRCWKYRTDITPLHRYAGTLDEWLRKEVRKELH